MNQIERFGRLDSDSRNVDQIITSTIKQMIKSPQGYKISDGENANGEMEGGPNPEYERRARDNQDFLNNPSISNDGEYEHEQRDTEGIKQKREFGKDFFKKGKQLSALKGEGLFWRDLGRNVRFKVWMKDYFSESRLICPS